MIRECINNRLDMQTQTFNGDDSQFGASISGCSRGIKHSSPVFATIAYSAFGQERGQGDHSSTNHSLNSSSHSSPLHTYNDCYKRETDQADQSRHAVHHDWIDLWSSERATIKEDERTEDERDDRTYSEHTMCWQLHI